MSEDNFFVRGDSGLRKLVERAAKIEDRKVGNFCKRAMRIHAEHIISEYKKGKNKK